MAQPRKGESFEDWEQRVERELGVNNDGHEAGEEQDT